ncbi:hypothetical protein B0H14DRAFT_3029482 [Mycena olivaceomarginata]|nr:hypothetical protein B0H14DRAFT_3029482 [Mycena olivaceomarginata]
MMDAANRRLSLPLSLFSAGPPGRVVLSHTNGASASDEPRQKLRKTSTRQPKNEDRDDNEVVNLVREEAEEENNISPASRNFDVSQAAEQCNKLEGYVSFRDVMGLGAPPDTPPRRSAAAPALK